MITNLTLRQRFVLFFGLLYLGGLAAIVGGLWFGHHRAGGEIGGYVVAGLFAAFGLLGTTVWIAFLFDENVAKPIDGLAADLTTRAQTEVNLGIDVKPARYLGALAPSARAINETLISLRNDQMRAIAAETEALSRDTALFEAMLRDLDEGVVVVSANQRVMLFNRVAQGLLEDLGLDRDLGTCLQIEPLGPALDRLSARIQADPTAVETFLASTSGGDALLLGRVGAMMSDGALTGFVLIFSDATESLTAHREYDHLFNTLLEHTRRPVAAISAVLDVLQSDAEMPPELRVTFTASMQEEVDRLIKRLKDVSARHDDMVIRHWPMSNVSTREIFLGLAAGGAIDLREDSGEHFVTCDVHAILRLLLLVMNRVRDTGLGSGFWLGARPDGSQTQLTLRWKGQVLADDQLNEWLQEPLSPVYGAYSGRDALSTHRTEVWPEQLDGGCGIVLSLQTSAGPESRKGKNVAEFFDFGLRESSIETAMENQLLSDLSFVVFDTETTGLSPRGGDEIVQIAGVRVVNGRILKSDVFDILVDPKRPIPEASTKIHGIDASMVKDAPDIAQAGQKFHKFCQGAVLVAHNAPFDMAFLKLKEAQIGRCFDQPVLCTVLLSAVMFAHTNQHTLDALAARLGVELPEAVRHTAIGDALATAEVFLHLIELMKHAGISTLGDAINAARGATQITKAQNY